MQSRIRKTVIIGGGTAGWITAAALAKVLGKVIDIELVESEAIGTVGVGEATIPQLKILNRVLELDEDEFVSRTNGTFKLGIKFTDWGGLGQTYMHTFGSVGADYDQVPFHQYFLRHIQSGGSSDFWDYSLHWQAAMKNKFARVEAIKNVPMNGLSYAFHFDAALYAKMLREKAESWGVVRSEGRVTTVNQHPESGHIKSVSLSDGRVIEGDLFIDCSGFRSLLLGQTLGVEFEDWSHWLPVNCAVSVGCERTEPLLPYTKSTARQAGWQWRIPLQHRTGNGHVFCESYMSETEASDILLKSLDGKTLSEPRSIRFTTGRRKAPWNKNCVAIGLSSGFLEPLESTSIHMIQSDVNRLISLFPSNGFVDADIAEYNAQASQETERIRDFLIVHYKQTERQDTPFWAYVKNMPVPDSLSQKMALFASHGRLFRDQHDLFSEANWVQVMMGQGLVPNNHSVMADRLSEAQLNQLLTNIKGLVGRMTDGLSGHDDFIRAHCAAQDPTG